MQYLLILILFSTSVMAGLPPTSTKGTGDSSYITTFQMDYGAIPLTHNGVQATLGTIPIAQGGTGKTTALDFGDVINPTANQISTPTSMLDLQSYLNHMWSAGVVDGAYITDNGNGTINLTSANAVLRSSQSISITSAGLVATVTMTAHGLKTGDNAFVYGAVQTAYNGEWLVNVVDANTFTYTMLTTAASPATGTIKGGSDHSDLLAVAVPAANNVALTNHAVNYVLVSYNGGVPIYEVVTSLSDFNCMDRCLAYTISREDNTLFIINGTNANVDTSRRDRIRLIETEGFQYVIGGSLISHIGTRNVAVTAGAFYSDLVKVPHAAFDTSVVGAANVNNFSTTYATAGTWQVTTGVKDVCPGAVCQYDNGAGSLSNITATNYGAYFFYIMNNSPSSLMMQFGTGNHNRLSDCQASSVPTPSTSIAGVGALIGRVCVLQGAANFADISSAFAAQFTPTTASNHENLAGLLGGAINDHYHLTTAQLALVTGAATSGTSNLVLRDSSGDFSAGTITASLNGNASTVTTNANLTGPVTSVGNATAIAPGALSLSRTTGTSAYRIPYASLSTSWLQDSSAFTFNDATSTLTVPNIVGTLAGNATGTASNITGVAALANGGTATSANSTIALFGYLAPTTAIGDLIYRSSLGAGGNSRLASGANSQVLASNAGVPYWREYDPLNLLVNPSFESNSTSWTAASSTVLAATTSSAYIYDVTGVQSLTASASNSRIGLFQDVTPVNGLAGTQGTVGVALLVPSQYSDVSICARVNGATNSSSCITAINNGVFREYEIPFVFGSAGQTAGIDIRTAATYNSSSFIGVDKAKVKSGMNIQNLASDIVYTADISATGVVSNENRDWLAAGPFTPTGTNKFALTINAGIFSSTPNCYFSSTDAISNEPSIVYDSSVTASNVLLGVRTFSGASVVANSFKVYCMKNGNDYLSASGSVYAQSSSNYPFRSCGLTSADITGFGTATSINFQCSRQGEELVIKGQFTAGTPTTTEARINFSAGGTLTSSSTLNALEVAQGAYIRGNTTSTSHGGLMLIEPSKAYLTFGRESTFGSGATDSFTKANADAMSISGNTISFSARIPVSGWTSASQLVGSFSGIPSVPGQSGIVETFNVNYGATATTACTSGACAYLDQIGTGVTSITHAGSAGTYNMLLPQTYTKLKCIGSASAGVSAIIDAVNAVATNNTSFVSRATTTGAAANSYGELSCKGTR